MKLKKRTILLTLALLLCGVAVGILAFGDSGEKATDYRFTQEMVVKDGMAQEPSQVIPFTLAEGGTYMISVDWEAPKPGVITGLSVRNQEGDSVFSVTGESVNAESTDLALSAGEYRVEYLFLTDENQFAGFIEETGAVEVSKDAERYDYAKEVSYEVEYHFVIERCQSATYKVGLVAGMLMGVAVGLVLIVLLLKFVRTDKSDEAKYDERQLRVRGDGFKYGFFAGVVYNGILCLVNIAEIDIPIAEEVLLFIGMIVSILVYAIYCIRKEAYLSLNESASRFKILFSVLGIVNVGIGLMNLLHGEMIEDGILTFRGINLLCGVFLLIIAVVLHLQTRMTEQEEE